MIQINKMILFNFNVNFLGVYKCQKQNFPLFVRPHRRRGDIRNEKHKFSKFKIFKFLFFYEIIKIILT